MATAVARLFLRCQRQFSYSCPPPLLEPQWNGIYPSVLLWQKAPSTTTMALGDLRCITGLTLDCCLTNKWNWSLINIWNRIYQHSATEIKANAPSDFGGIWRWRFIKNSQPLTRFFTLNKPQLPHFLPKLAFSIDLWRTWPSLPEDGRRYSAATALQGHLQWHK